MTVRKRRGLSSGPIPSSDYYISNGLEGLLLDAKFYDEVEYLYHRLPDQVVSAILPLIPLPHDIRWSGQLMWNKKYWEENGSLPKSTSKDQHLKYLHGWIITQRSAAREGLLRSERMKALDTHLPTWRADRDTQWYDILYECERFVVSEKRVPNRISSKEENKLYVWLERQRYLQSRGKLPAKKKKDLDTRIPLWYGEPQNKDWYTRLQEFDIFVSQNGRFPQSSTSLGTWLAKQRQSFRKGTLSEDQWRALDDVALSWKDTRVGDQQWDKTLQEVLDFFSNNGYPPKRGKESTHHESRIASWLKMQKTLIAQDKLDPNRKKKFESALPWVQDDPWETTLKSVSEYILRNGIPNSGSNNPDERAAGIWLSYQRGEFKRGNLSQNRILQLDLNIPEWKKTLAGFQWQAQLKKCVDSYSQNNSIPPRNAEDSELDALGMWVKRQRELLRTGSLEKYKEDILDEKLPGWRVAPRFSKKQ